MIVIIATVETTAESIAAMREAIATMETASRAEPGCHDYAFNVALNDPNCLRITECWEDEAALKAHFATPHMAAFNEAMTRAGPRNISVACYEANAIPFPLRG